MMSTTGKILSEKLDVLQLAFYTTPISSCVLLPFFWFLEVRRCWIAMLNLKSLPKTQHPQECIAFV